ncbi:hypothetical protein [Blattabacterium cuenoti]|uniref:hypothetical protein n=1 Tax=Blattabacterium cuenoti TaxID=1653831 RepID=UPI001EEC8C72|nr:hypothetical protein [Blattabacterium cuenoti]
MKVFSKPFSLYKRLVLMKILLGIFILFFFIKNSSFLQEKINEINKKNMIV